MTQNDPIPGDESADRQRRVRSRRRKQGAMMTRLLRAERGAPDLPRTQGAALGYRRSPIRPRGDSYDDA